MRLLHVADVHLGASYSAFGALAADRAREVLDAFRRLPDIAAERRVDAVLIAGDLFDGPQPGPDLLAAVRETLRRLVEDVCIPAFLVPGNHDSTSLKLNPYRELARAARVEIHGGPGGNGRKEWPVVDEEGQRLAEKHTAYIIDRAAFGPPVTVRTAAGPLHVYGLAYDAAECTAPLATFQRADGEGMHVALLHATVHHASHWRGSGNGLVVSAEELAALPVDYVALGDQHRHRSPEEFEAVPACYPGSFAATDLTEVGRRGYCIVDLEPGRAPGVELHDAGVRPVEAHEVDVGDAESDVEVAQRVARMISPDAIPVVRLAGEPGFPLDSDAVAAELRERFGHAAVLDETRFYAAERLAELARRDTVVGHVVRLGRERVEAATRPEEREVAQRALRVALRALGVD